MKNFIVCRWMLWCGVSLFFITILSVWLLFSCKSNCDDVDVDDLGLSIGVRFSSDVILLKHYPPDPRIGAERWIFFSKSRMVIPDTGNSLCVKNNEFGSPLIRLFEEWLSDELDVKICGQEKLTSEWSSGGHLYRGECLYCEDGSYLFIERVK